MLKFDNGGVLVQHESELPNLAGTKELFLDCETTSGDPKLTSLNPWRNCDILGICVTTDTYDRAWYIPERFTQGWLADTLASCQRWINHNVKYDAHVCANAGALFNCELVDTLTLAKIIDSDKIIRGGYSLTALSRDWLQDDVGQYEYRLKNHLRARKSKDYGDVPEDIIAEYGCQDALTTKKLWSYIQHKMPEQCHGVRDTEIKLTSVLFDIEQGGMRIDEQAVKIAAFRGLNKMLEIEAELHDLTDIAMRPHTNNDCFEVLCGKYGLPVVEWTESNNPSFDKAALVSYASHPEVTGKLATVVKLIMEYRKLHTLQSVFLEPYMQLAIDGVLHPSYNQSVRTGRMSCKQPNAQQLSPAAKSFIIPNSGMSFIDDDYSQIEFRFIVHYIRNEAAIAAYARDPMTDFHTWVSEMCGIPRKPAKNVNFCMAFGGGKNRVLSMLAADMELMTSFTETDPRRFNALCKQRAEGVYRQYHSTLPELKETSWRVAKTLERRGYVWNAYGRHRHLPIRASFRAFNSVIQASAADMIKEAAVATSPRFNTWVKSHGVRQVAVVHDNILFECPSKEAKKVAIRVTKIMESPSIKLRVPIKAVASTSDQNWGDCD